MSRDAAPKVSLAELINLFTNHERKAYAAPVRERDDQPPMHVGVVGGGTAGWLAALAVRARLPHAKVSLLESTKIPIIGVGEATVPSIIPFLHHYLQLDVLKFYAAVRPTWKQGIRFEWGLPGDYHFQAPFDWDVNGVGMVGSLQHTGNLDSMTLQSILMSRDRTAIVRDNAGNPQSLLTALPYAYHLDNERLVRFLRETAVERGVEHIDCTIVDAVVSAADRVDHVIAGDGRSFHYDVYLDCSGFRSLLLERTLGSRFVSYASSLPTDRAVAFNVSHGGHIKPYTTARTMNSGWCWNIPMVEDDHLGYVFASSFCSDAEAVAEAKTVFPTMGEPRFVQFRSGRHEEMWRGNVAAIGNSYGFVEPLESTGILMICREIQTVIDGLRAGRNSRAIRAAANASIARAWDQLRWFLAIHYKFNRKLDTPFWTTARETTDVSGIQPAIDLFREGAPLSFRPHSIRSEVADIIFYRVAGFDCLMLGQQVEASLPGQLEPPETWRARRDAAHAIAHYALPHAAALEAVRLHPELLTAVIDDPTSWTQHYVRDW